MKRGSVVEMPDVSSDMEVGLVESGTSSTFSVSGSIFCSVMNSIG